MELYTKTLYLLGQSESKRNALLDDFFQYSEWKDGKKNISNGVINKYAEGVTGYGWEKISYKFACSFIHLSVLHNWENEDISLIIATNDKQTIIEYINQYHNANLNIQSSFLDIMRYSLDIFEKIKSNMEYYLDELEKKGQPI